MRAAVEKRGNAAEAFVATLKANGVDTIFGLPGSTEAPLLEALRADDAIRYVLTLQETITVAMADGYARTSGRPGVVGLHTSVGTMNGLSQLYNAARDGSPVVVTAGHKDSGVLAIDGFCALADLPGLARGFVKHAWQSLRSDAVAADLRRALGVATARPSGPTYLALPEDVQAGPAPDPGPAAKAYGAAPVRRPDRDAIAAAARRLAAAQRPILVLGATAAPFVAEARALAAALELPVFAIDRTELSTLPYPVRDPRYLGQYGEERSLIEDADCVLAIGPRVFYPFSSDGAPKLPPDATLVHAHAESEQLGWDVVPEIGIAADAGAVLADLRDAVEALGGLPADVRAARIARLSELRARYGDALTRERGRQDTLAAEAGTVSLAALADALGAALPDDALVFDEAISSSRPLLRLCPFGERARVFRTAGGSLGWGVPAAIGAKIAEPSRAVVALVGDGSFHFTPQALWTATRENAPIVAIVVDNGGYLAVKLAIERHLRVGEDPRLHPGTTLPAIDHVAVARGYGADARRVEDAAQLAPAIAEALAAERSTVIVVPVANARR